MQQALPQTVNLKVAFFAIRLRVAGPRGNSEAEANIFSKAQVLRSEELAAGGGVRCIFQRDADAMVGIPQGWRFRRRELVAVAFQVSGQEGCVHPVWQFSFARRRE